MLIPNEHLTLGQGECITVEITAPHTPRLALWLITREYGAYHLLNKHLWGKQREAVLRTASINGRTKDGASCRGQSCRK